MSLDLHRSCDHTHPRQLTWLHGCLRHGRRVRVSHGGQKGLQRGGAGGRAGLRRGRYGIAGAQTLAGGADWHHRGGHRGWWPRSDGRADCETAPSRRNYRQRPAVSECIIKIHTPHLRGTALPDGSQVGCIGTEIRPEVPFKEQASQKANIFRKHEFQQLGGSLSTWQAERCGGRGQERGRGCGQPRA